ncbi:hypothetical protein AXF42_Ash011931 [Apostasia shenzhenica]|uniref:Uncharacterized protein n=1 Tax=Apostasia shenzhenica TaxID=1088818 RepID=A0A2I0AWB1_9ASPA|nr:hypothetical protein AXF42_Ash011931 [Apostasia shenzhenica]
MVARMRRTNSAARSAHAEEPSIRAPGDELPLQDPGVAPDLPLPLGVPASQSFRGCWRTSPTYSPASPFSKP